MPNPLVGSVHVDAALSNMSVAYVQDKGVFAARRMFPVVPVQHRSDKYYVYNQSDFLRDEVQARAAGTESAGAGYRLTTETYTAERYALHQMISDELLFNADPAIDPERDAVEFITQKMLIHEDRKFDADFMQAGSAWGTKKNGSTSDFTQFTVSSTDIISTIDSFSDEVQKKTGKRPNKLLLSRDVYSVFKNNATILESIKYTQRGIVTPDLLAALFGLSEVIVADSIHESAAEGGTSSLAYNIGGGKGLLAYVAPTPSLLTPSAGYTFSWSPFSDAAGGATIKNFRMDELSADRIEGEAYWDQKAVSTDCGLFFYNAI